jgi:hypothetical protein
MRTSKELVIRGKRSDLERMLDRVEARLGEGWKRDREAENRLGQAGVRGPWDVCFSCTAKGDRPAAGLWVHPRGLDELSVSNVVPRDRQQLSEDENNRLLAEFEREFLRPVASEVGVETEVVEHRLTLEEDLSAEAVRLLRAFSASANRAGLHPNDRRRWNAFLVRAHQDESFFDPALLDEWLQQEGWPEATRSQLVEEYEAARSLLVVYDEEARRR